MLHKRTYTIVNIAALLSVGSLTAQNNRPNIIYIMSDDHSAQAISAYGGLLSTILPTPNIDRIGREGVRLEDCCVTNSISTPSRGCIITGQYSHLNGVYTLDDPLDPAHDNVAKELQKNGYQTAIFGKWHLHAEPAGFDFYNVFPGQGRYNDPILISTDNRAKAPNVHFDQTPGSVYKGHSTDVVADQTLKWLEQTDKSKPFMVMCHFKAPHRNWLCAERFRDLLKDVVIPEPDNLLDTYENKAAYVKMQQMSLEHMRTTDLKTELPTNLTRDEFRKWAYQIYIKDYLRCIAGVDENVGRLLKYLDDNGLSENTIVVYTSDQGFFLGEHGWFDKRYMQEESMRMPFVIRYPKEIKPGKVNKDIITNIDFAPTLLDFAGIGKPEYMQGESFRPNLKGKTPKDWRKAMYYRYWLSGENDHHTVGHYGIRTDRYKLIFYYAQPLGKTGARKIDYTPDWELYDMKKDPKEMVNLYNDPKYTKLIKELKLQLLELKKQYGDPDTNYPEMKEVVDQYFW